MLVTSCVDAPKSFELIGDEEIYETIASWLTEPVEKLDERFEAAWQQRFGRFNQTKAVRSLKKRTVNGFEALIRTRFISGVSENPFGFDVDDFVGSEAERWGKKRAQDEKLQFAFYTPHCKYGQQAQSRQSRAAKKVETMQ